MSAGSNEGMTRLVVIAIAFGVGALVYMFMPSCAAWVADEDDTLCHALAAAEDGNVDWPVHERWFGGKKKDQRCHVFDNILMSPWWFSEEARSYLEGFGIAQGHNWGHMGRADIRSYDEETGEVDTPLGRTYNAYANIVYANLEGIELDRGRPLSDFDYYDTYLKWVSAYVFQRTYRVNGNCSRECESIGSEYCVIAKTVSGSFRNDYIDLYQTFYYDIDAIWRACTIVHEVRHARQATGHSGGSGCGRKSSCDRKWSDNGSNAFEMQWLAAYYWGPEDNAFLTEARRDRAAALFWTLRRDAFNETPMWTLNDFKTINDNPELFVNRTLCSDSPDQLRYCMGLGN
jgi:hypothetical protein